MDDKPIWREPLPWIAATVWIGTFLFLGYFDDPSAWPRYALPAFAMANLMCAIVFMVGSIINISKIRR